MSANVCLHSHFDLNLMGAGSLCLAITKYFFGPLALFLLLVVGIAIVQRKLGGGGGHAGAPRKTPHSAGDFRYRSGTYAGDTAVLMLCTVVSQPSGLVQSLNPE